MKSAPIKSCHIMLVEDSPFDANFFKFTLQKSELPITLTLKHDGEDALATLRESFTNPTTNIQKFDAVILDLSMPGFSGIEFLEQSWQLRKEHPIMVLVLSGSNNANDKEICRKWGATDYFIKPWELEGYISMLKGPMREKLALVRPDVFLDVP
ncbi:MAG: response regulator [Planctomycetota bacterium]